MKTEQHREERGMRRDETGIERQAMTTTRYGFGITLRDVTFEDVVKRVTDSLKNEGFGVLTEIDVRETQPLCQLRRRRRAPPPRR